jgi:uncharacterized protein (DUF58 family)
LLGLRLTFGGLLYAMVLVMIGAAALNSEANLLFLLCGVGVGVFLFSAVAPILMVRQVEVDRIAPDAAVAGRLFKITYLVRNRRRWSHVWSLVIEELPVGGAAKWLPGAFLATLGPGQQQRVDLNAKCPRRGVVKLAGVRVVSRFPFGFFSCSVRHAISGELVVYPPVGRLRGDPWQVYRQMGTSQSRFKQSHTAGDEFYGVREYRTGDNVRWIHWRRSAHAGELVVREMAWLPSTQMTVVIDPWSTASAPASAKHYATSDVIAERLISTAASFICDALERGYRVGLICRGSESAAIAPAGGRPHRRRLLHALAMLNPGACEGLDELMHRVRWTAGLQARCLVIASQFGHSHDRVVRFLGRRAETVLTLSASSPMLKKLVEWPTERVVEGGNE